MSPHHATDRLRPSVRFCNGVHSVTGEVGRDQSAAAGRARSRLAQLGALRPQRSQSLQLDQYHICRPYRGWRVVLRVLFFNAAELLRAAAGWPGEFLYSRPFAFANQVRIDNTPGALANPFGRSTSSPDEKPFARSARPLQTLAQSPIQNAPASGNSNVTSPSTPSGTGTLPPPPVRARCLVSLVFPCPAVTRSCKRSTKQSPICSTQPCSTRTELSWSCRRPCPELDSALVTRLRMRHKARKIH